MMSLDEKPKATNLHLIFKWGIDGSSNHSLYQQKTSSAEFKDSDMMAVCISPLRLVTEDGGQTVTIWKNPRPSSTRFCRPVIFKFVKESQDVIQQMVDDMKAKIQNLEDIVVKLEDQHFFYLDQNAIVNG
jgi:hypothetical protein